MNGFVCLYESNFRGNTEERRIKTIFDQQIMVITRAIYYVHDKIQNMRIKMHEKTEKYARKYDESEKFS